MQIPCPVDASRPQVVKEQEELIIVGGKGEGLNLVIWRFGEVEYPTAISERTKGRTMLDLMPLSLIVAYVIFSTFAYYQSLHVKNFRGASQLFALFLNLSAFAAMICGLIFLFYYGWNVRWYLPILLFIISLIFQSVWFMIETSLRMREFSFIISLLGFIGWPIAAFFMFRAIPMGN